MTAEDDRPSDYILKLVAIGDPNTGKTSLSNRFATNTFKKTYIVTLGMNMIVKKIALKDSVVELPIWDIGTQPSFKSIVPMYYQGSLGAVVVFDKTKMTTFKNVNRWITELRGHVKEIPLIILGNKIDLVDEIEVHDDQITEYLADLRGRWSEEVFYYDTSAKTAENVNEAFVRLAEYILKKVKAEEVDEEEFL